MTDEEHIQSVGKALTRMREAIAVMEKAVADTKKSEAVLHRRLERMQADYIASKGGNVVAFSGGTNKPPNDTPDEPVPPVP